MQTHIWLDMHIAYPSRHSAHWNNCMMEPIDSLAFKHGATCNCLLSTCRSDSTGLTLEGFQHTSLIDIMTLVHAKEGNHVRHLMHDGNQLAIREGKWPCDGIGATDCNNGWLISKRIRPLKGWLDRFRKTIYIRMLICERELSRSRF